MYGAGPTIQLLLGSGAHHYLEFKLVQGRWADASTAEGWAVTRHDAPGAQASSCSAPPSLQGSRLTWPFSSSAAVPPSNCSYMLQASAGGAAQLRSVPSSRADVFKDRQLSPLQVRLAGCAGPPRVRGLQTRNSMRWQKHRTPTLRSTSAADACCPAQTLPCPALLCLPTEAQPDALPESGGRGAGWRGPSQGALLLRCTRCLDNAASAAVPERKRHRLALASSPACPPPRAAPCPLAAINPSPCRTRLVGSPSSPCWSSRGWTGGSSSR